MLVISNPDSAQGTISEGLVSAFPENRSLAQITAPISISSTGSPVIDEFGNVIGLAVQTEKEEQKISLAIAAESIKNLLANPPAKIAATPQQQAPSKTAATPQQKAAHPGYGLAYDDTPNIVRFMDDFGLSGKWASQAANLRAFFEEFQERLADPSFMINEFNQAAKDRKSPADEVYRLCKFINQCHEEP